ncbi:hypothetical protein V8E36_009392 [Tilletia maclaganii]
MVVEISKSRCRVSCPPPRRRPATEPRSCEHECQSQPPHAATRKQREQVRRRTREVSDEWYELDRMLNFTSSSFRHRHGWARHTLAVLPLSSACPRFSLHYPRNQCAASPVLDAAALPLGLQLDALTWCRRGSSESMPGRTSWNGDHSSSGVARDDLRVRWPACEVAPDDGHEAHCVRARGYVRTFARYPNLYARAGEGGHVYKQRSSPHSLRCVCQFASARLAQQVGMTKFRADGRGGVEGRGRRCWHRRR